MTLVLNGTTGVSAVDGSASTPAIQGNDTNTGVFFPAADTVAIATGGTERVRTDSSGNVGIGVTPTVTAGVTELALGSASTNPRINGVRDGASAFLIYSDSSGMDVYERRNLYLRFGTNNTERARIDSSGNFSITQTPGKYTVDVTGGSTSIANGGTVDFPNASGMLVVNNYSNGNVTIYLCGGGVTAAIGSVGGQVGTLSYVGGIAGYRWTNNSGSTATFGFFFVRTRPTA